MFRALGCTAMALQALGCAVLLPSANGAMQPACRCVPYVSLFAPLPGVWWPDCCRLRLLYSTTP